MEDDCLHRHWIKSKEFERMWVGGVFESLWRRMDIFSKQVVFFGAKERVVSLGLKFCK